MTNAMILKRPAPLLFQEIEKPTSVKSQEQEWPNMPVRKRQRVDSTFTANSSKTVTQHDWLELDSILNGNEIDTIRSEENVSPLSLTPEISQEMHLPEPEWIPTTNSRDDQRDEEMPPVLTLSTIPEEADCIPSTANLVPDYHNVVEAQEDEIPTVSTTPTACGPKQTGDKSELLTLISFPFRVLAADESFYRSSGLSSARVIGQPLLSVVKTGNKHIEANPQRIVNTPLDFFDENSENHTVILPNGQEPKMKVEQVVSKAPGLNTPFAHYKVVLE
ncbi:unnamed protein product [Cylindrotheca closterium]|uniref:PAS domain-containing protein n=1 Tax=Cylindrotheca closterium TaxID=2856 RepID=A0AAD2CER9_9STRA|nr:unnamed protein product [Cylindrotheca closterium]